MILQFGKGEKHVQSEARRGGDHCGAQAGRGGAEGGRCGAGSGVSKHTIYAWKAKYGGMEVSEAQEVKQLREENARFKKLVADLSMDNAILKEAARGNW